MTQEEKQLLLKDLCARLPYGIIIRVHDIEYGDFDSYVDSISNDCVETFPVEELTIDFNPCVFYKLQEIKPYLRPMSSMTEEEENEYRAINCYEGLFPCNEDALDYVLSHHLDFRGLIPIGLALEASEDLYKTE